MINILILNWNSRESVYMTISRISEFYNKDKIRLIIINNDTFDIENRFKDIREPEIHIINNKDNLGYTGGNNSGYKYLVENNLDGDILVVNPDVTIDPQIIDSLMTAIDEDNVAAAMPMAVDENNNILYCSIELDGFSERRIKQIRNEEYLETDYIAGSCFILKRKVLEQTYLFDEDFFLYWEEVDLSLRLKELGYKLLAIQNIKVVRETNVLSRQINSQYYLTRNSFLIRSKHYRSFSLSSHISYLTRRFAVVFYLSLRMKNISALKNFTKGFLDGVRLTNGKRK